MVLATSSVIKQERDQGKSFNSKHCSPLPFLNYVEHIYLVINLNFVNDNLTLTNF